MANVSYSEQIYSAVSVVDGLVRAFPASNADGSANPTAQLNAFNAFIDSAVEQGFFVLPAPFTVTALKAIAPSLLKIISDYKVATQRPSL